jgi:prolyl oligopeptidase
MKVVYAIVAALAASLAHAQSQPTQQKSSSPATPRHDVQEVLHGVTVKDPYRWLEDQNSLETRAWITEQNNYTHSHIDQLPGRSALESRLAELKKIEGIHSPFERKGRFVYRRRKADQEQYVICMREGETGKEQVLLDPNPMSADHTTNVDIFDVSKDGKLLAYMLRAGGKDETEVHFLELDTHQELPDVLPLALYFDVGLLPDRSGLYYSITADDGPRVRFHRFGTPVSSDVDVFGKGYTKESIIIGDPTEDGRHLVVLVCNGSACDKAEIWVQDLTTRGAIEPLVKDIDARFYAYAGGNQLFLQTNWKAPNGRILAVDFAHPGRENWKEVVPESDAAIDAVALSGGKIIVAYVKNATSQVKVFEPSGKLAGKLEFPTLGSVTDIQTKWENADAFIGFTSFTIPRNIYKFDMANRKRSLLYQSSVPVDISKFEIEQVWATSKDGTRVPMFLIHAKGIKADGSRPALLTGYGGFVLNITPDFWPEAIVWAEHGGVAAQVNLRGGGEFGEAWHKAGMLGNKQNVFDDFIAASEWLVQNKYTNPSKLAIFGGSNGGLLVGAAFTQRPDLYQAVVCWHPLLDMLRYDQFMMGKFWVSEYGSASDPEQFKWLYAYSPYQHVKPGTNYPAILFMTGDGDTRVAPLHARKMTALMQASTGSERPVLLRYETAAGHAGGRSVTQDIGDSTDYLSFLFWQLSVSQE